MAIPIELQNFLSLHGSFFDIIAYLLILAGCFSVINQSVYFTYFWQLKEYRLDRMNDFLLTKSGLTKFFPIFWIIKMVFAVLSILIIYSNVSGWIKSPIVFFIALFAGLTWIFEIGDFLWRLKNRRIYRPDKTAKSLLIVFLTIILLLLFFGFYWVYFAGRDPLLLIKRIVVLWLISMAVLPFNSIVILLFWPVTLLGKKRAIAKASRKIAQMQGLRVIGITGSYGKSSAKEFLAAILETKFKVLKTPGNINTDIGVAGVVMKDLKPEHEVFIVEAGAYKIGEIKKIVDLVKPRIGIVTAVKDAHLGLFGSPENIRKAKFELIEGLPEFGTAVFNVDSEGAEGLAGQAEHLKLSKVIRYSAAGKTADIAAHNIIVEKEKVSFEVKEVKFELTVCGGQSVSSALAAISAAKEFGMSLDEMVTPLRSAKLRDHTMSLKKANKDLWLIDDTYNANPDGVMAGLEYLRQAYPDWQKIIVFPGMLELGQKSSEEHRRVANKIAQVCDFAIFTSKDFEKEILAGLKKVGEENQRQDSPPTALKDYKFIVGEQKAVLDELKGRTAGRKTVILFSSRGAEEVIKGLL
jgi:UDP-N-acetylmuramoyl-tripeptide--D-alanyl-D-alanine ligase